MALCTKLGGLYVLHFQTKKNLNYTNYAYGYYLQSVVLMILMTSAELRKEVMCHVTDFFYDTYARQNHVSVVFELIIQNLIVMTFPRLIIMKQ